MSGIGTGARSIPNAVAYATAADDMQSRPL
jgi:hypothetical protein